MAHIIMHRYFKEINLMEIPGQVRSLCQFGNAFRGTPKSQRLQQVRAVFKDAVAQGQGGCSPHPSPDFPRDDMMATVASAVEAAEGENCKGNMTAPPSGEQNFLSNPQKISLRSG